MYTTQLEQKNSSVDALETVGGPVSHDLHHPSPKAAQLSAKRNLLGWRAYSSWEAGDCGVGGSEWECDLLQFPSYVDTAMDTHFFPAPHRVLSPELHDQGLRRGWESSR